MSGTPAVVVVGAGLAAAKAVESMRAQGFAGAITIVGDEPERPYERPALSKDYLQGRSSVDDLFVHPHDWYREHDVETRFADAAVSIDRAADAVTLDSGAVLPYDRLLLATGSRPRRLDVPGADLAGVLSLRRIGDSDRLREAFGATSRVAIVGAGWIGLETAAAARAAGLEVTVLETAPLPLARVLGDELATYFADLHRRHGVDLRTSVSVAELLGSDGHVTGVRLGDTEVVADRVVVGVGVVPNTELASAAGLEVDNGIVVDQHLRTSDPSIFAAGDVANAHNTTLGRRLRVEHWDNAVRQGTLAGRTMLDQDGAYDWQPYFYTDQYDLGMEYVGAASPDDTVAIRGDRDGGELIAFWLEGDRLTAGMNVNVWDVSDDIRALLGRSVDVARLTDPQIPLADV
jgi:3-phenylpropionate/trans-cinnamate dioxygenase ferredoxin reductase subunit